MKCRQKQSDVHQPLRPSSLQLGPVLIRTRLSLLTAMLRGLPRAAPALER